MSRLTLLVVAVLGACLVLAGTAYADETETPTPEPEPSVVETAVAPDTGETPAPIAETPAPDEETPLPVDETPRPVEPAPVDEPAGDEGEVIAPAPDEEQVIAPAPDEESLIAPAPGTPEAVIAAPATGAGSPSGGSWAWWPLAVAAGAAAGTAGVLLAYQGRRAKS